MRNIKFLPLALISVLLFSCKKDEIRNSEPAIDKLTDVKVPEGFNWESSRNVTFNIKISDPRFANLHHVIAIYGPDTKLITKGSASQNQAFVSIVNLPNSITEVYVICNAPDGTSNNQKVSLNKNTVDITFSQGKATSAAKSRVLAESPDCTTGCNESITLTSNNQKVIVKDGKTYCVSGTAKTFDVLFSNGGGTLRICGSGLVVADLANNKVNDPMKIVITSGSSVTFDDRNNKATNFNQNNNTFQNYGEVTFDGGINLAGQILNNGTIKVIGEYSTETQTSPQTVHTNNGLISVEGVFDVGANSLFHNNGTVKVTDFHLFNSAVFNNYCKLWITNQYDHSTKMNNHGYIRVDAKTFINGSSELAQYGGAQLTTKDIKIDGTIKGYNSASLVKVTNYTDFTGSGLLTGTLQYCDVNGLEKNLGVINGGASLGCSLYIATNNCNSEGNGAQIIKDRDGDGLADNQDEYPTDAEKAFDNYIIPGGFNAGATVSFEDMWPKKGDYDLNDVVMSYQLKVITNSANKVVAVDGIYSLTARGGIFHNGFGIEFPLSREKVSEVVGATLEEGQTKAVLILFSNTHAQMFYMNTLLSEPLSTSVSYSISFKVTDGPALSEFGLSEYNPFIWNQDIGRGAEVHLPGKTPTNLADPKYFGTEDDRSNPAQGKYYVSADNFPWAITIPQKGFIYPVEGKDIVTAYLKFPAWVSSGGTQYTDWYSNTTAGYRNESNLYIR